MPAPVRQSPAAAAVGSPHGASTPRRRVPASIAVVVPTRDARRYLDAVIPALLRAAARAGVTEIVVVDNGSRDGTAAHVVATWPDSIRVLHAEGVHVGEVRNIGARATTGEVLSFVDADCVLDEDYYEQALAVLGDQSLDATGSRYDLPDDARWIERTWDGLHRTARTGGPVDYLNAGNFLVRRSAFDAVGGFDARLESGEDAELGQRLRRRGSRIVSAPRVRARHLGNPKTLTGFVRKQRWHAMGMFGTVDARGVDKPTAMLAVHLLLPLAALALVPAGIVEPLGGLGLAAAGTFVVPAASVAWRWRRAERPGRPLASLLLYWLYFHARASALARLLVDAGRSRATRAPTAT